MDKKTVIVTGIGGNVGQGIIRNIQATGFPITVIGTNISDFSSGNHLCDLFYKVPYAEDKNYLSTLNDIIQKHNVDLVIPATDFEVFYLSQQKEELLADVVVSTHDTSAIYLDKFLTFEHLNRHSIPFASAHLPSKFNNEFSNVILKPRKGRGSRGLHINPKDLSGFDDMEYMVQELIFGTEITTAFYVNKKKKLHGFITFERTLENGMTTHCKVVDTYDDQLLTILDSLIVVSNIKGSANLQAIVNKDGEIKPFEINCRISGTNSIRSNFGFKDVLYTLEEWLYGKQPSSPKIKKGVATRVLMDVIYNEITDFNDAKDKSASHYLY